MKTLHVLIYAYEFPDVSADINDSRSIFIDRIDSKYHRHMILFHDPKLQSMNLFIDFSDASFMIDLDIY